MIVLLLAGTVLLDIEREPPFPEDAPAQEAPAREAAPAPPTPAPTATPPSLPSAPPRVLTDDCQISVAKYALEAMSREDREALAAHIREVCRRSW